MTSICDLSIQPVILFQTSHQEFSSLKQSNTEANQREEVLKKLASAHDSYVEISSNLREGTKVLTQHNTPAHTCFSEDELHCSNAYLVGNFLLLFFFFFFCASRWFCRSGDLFLSLFFFCFSLLSSTTT